MENNNFEEICKQITPRMYFVLKCLYASSKIGIRRLPTCFFSRFSPELIKLHALGLIETSD